MCKVHEVPQALLFLGMPIFSPLICNLATDVEILLNFVSLGGKNETFLSQILSTVSQFSNAVRLWSSLFPPSAQRVVCASLSHCLT